MAKIYAVKKGIKTGIFNTWDECKNQVNGFSGAEYKSFTNMSDALSYLGKNIPAENAQTDTSLDVLKHLYNNSEKALAYVDGSYDAKNKRYSCGVVIITDGEMLEYNEVGNDETLIDMHNVAGELLGATRAIEIVKSRNCSEIDIYYDYSGIEKWAEHEWKTNTQGTAAYVEFIDNIRKELKINFFKVKGHTGVELNERVDELAKNALGIKK